MRTRATFLNPRLPNQLGPFWALLGLVAGLILMGAVTASGEDVPVWGGAMEANSAPLSFAPQTVSSTSASWYATPWAMAAYAGAAVGVVVLLMRSRTAYLRRQKEELERIVEQRTGEVQMQKRQLESYNQELLRTNERLRNTVEEKSKLLGVAAHDLKNPLFGIRALAEIVLENGELSPKNEHKLNLIRESSDETLHLIDDLLATAAGTTRADEAAEPVDVMALTEWVVRSFEPHAERKTQSLYCVAETDGACIVEGRKRKLREAIDNLVSNALKYSPSGEEISVHVRRVDGEVTVSVTDAGPGLSESDRERMFAPFQRLTPEPTGDEGSSGLGLYIVKQVVEMHDGRIEVDTALGQGSTFTLGFPATTASASSGACVQPREENARS